jgi:hypothetical protein
MSELRNEIRNPHSEIERLFCAANITCFLKLACYENYISKFF